MLIHEQCDKYHRCKQCGRRPQNCGESNVWSESRFIPGSRLIVWNSFSLLRNFWNNLGVIYEKRPWNDNLIPSGNPWNLIYWTVVIWIFVHMQTRGVIDSRVQNWKRDANETQEASLKLIWHGQLQFCILFLYSLRQTHADKLLRIWMVRYSVSECWMFVSVS